VYIEFLGDIISEVDRMTNIINELLTIVKLDATEQALNINSVSVGKMLGEIIKRLLPLAVLKRVELTYEESRPVVIEADEIKLSLAISNLIENGIKYTQEGGMVHVLLEADHASAFVTVTDNGIGISEDDQSKVFVRFYRADKARDRESGGTGLGLAITHKTVLLHNGSIKLSSKEGEGSTFVVRLPIKRVEKG
jgi:signal transduction histidine kinase